MKWILEVTADSQYPNHIYYATDDSSKIVGYIPSGTQTFQKFSSPIRFSTKYRKFKVIDHPAEDDSVYVAVHTEIMPVIKRGNQRQVPGKPYVVSLTDGQYSCTCPGFTFRRKCRHVEEEKVSGRLG